MKKTSKIFLVITIILVISLGVIVYSYTKLNKKEKEYEEMQVYGNTLLTEYEEAAEKSGYELQEENNTFIFVEKK